MRTLLLAIHPSILSSQHNSASKKALKYPPFPSQVSTFCELFSTIHAFCTKLCIANAPNCSAMFLVCSLSRIFFIPHTIPTTSLSNFPHIRPSPLPQESPMVLGKWAVDPWGGASHSQPLAFSALQSSHTSIYAFVCACCLDGWMVALRRRPLLVTIAFFSLSLLPQRLFSAIVGVLPPVLSALFYGKTVGQAAQHTFGVFDIFLCICTQSHSSAKQY